ncbi:MAG: UDP-glucose 4-epimerase GalE [Hyphomonadaceae bacterium]
MSGETILVTGGAGYVGSHTALTLAEAGHRVVVYDNLSNGLRAFAKFGDFEEGDIRDRTRLDAVIARWKPAAVIHFAALIEVGVSVKEPASFWDVNVHGALTVLEAMRAGGVNAFVFSSTCATYGEPQRMPMDESHPQWPLSPYGWSKLAVERVLHDYRAAYGLRATMLRYFNAAGAAPEHGLGERHNPETHAIPLALFTLLGRRQSFSIFGEDYDTRDGTCVRDYVHVLDLADAHLRAVRKLIDGDAGDAFNLGTGRGATVKELLGAIETVTGRAAPATPAARRPGDSPALVADARKAERLLGWVPQRGLDEIIASAWRWHSEIEPGL